MRRGDIVTVAAPGDFGKPRPAVIIQGDALNAAGASSFIVALMTSNLQDAPLLRPSSPRFRTALEKTSQVQTTRIVNLRTETIGTTIGRLNTQQVALDFHPPATRKQPTRFARTPGRAAREPLAVEGPPFSVFRFPHSCYGGWCVP